MRAVAALLIVSASLAGCHKAPPAEGKGLALQDVRGVSAATLKRAGVSHVDPALLRLRSISGAWSSAVPGGTVILQMNTLGTWSAQQMRGSGADRTLMGAAHGKFAFNPDGTITGSADGGATGDVLSTLSSWSGGFATSYGGDLTIRGSGGGQLRFSRSQRGELRTPAPRIAVPGAHPPAPSAARSGDRPHPPAG